MLICFCLREDVVLRRQVYLRAVEFEKKKTSKKKISFKLAFSGHSKEEKKTRRKEAGNRVRAGKTKGGLRPPFIKEQVLWPDLMEGQCYFEWSG